MIGLSNKDLLERDEIKSILTLFWDLLEIYDILKKFVKSLESRKEEENND